MSLKFIKVNQHIEMVTLIPKLPFSANNWAMEVSKTRQSEFRIARIAEIAVVGIPRTRARTHAMTPARNARTPC